MLVATTLATTTDSVADDKPKQEERAREAGEQDSDSREHRRDGYGEHDQGDDDHHGAQGEESGTDRSLDEGYDEVRKGVRLLLAYDRRSNSFKGSVENTTSEPLMRVRVEVHLSSGRELGPTGPVDLEPGGRGDIQLIAPEKAFDRWTAHSEVGVEHDRGEDHDEVD